MKKRPLNLAAWIAMLLVPTLALASGEPPRKDIHVEEPWVREGPPVKRPLAGYLTLHNAGGKMAVLVGANSPAFSAIEFHRTEEHDGVARMLRMEQVHIGAGEKVRFEPGGLHLMMFGAVQHLRAGDRIELELRFANGRRLTTQAEVRKSAPEEHHHHH